MPLNLSRWPSSCHTEILAAGCARGRTKSLEAGLCYFVSCFFFTTAFVVHISSSSSQRSAFRPIRQCSANSNVFTCFSRRPVPLNLRRWSCSCRAKVYAAGFPLLRGRTSCVPFFFGPRLPINICGYPRISVKPLVYKGTHGIPQDFMRFPWDPMDSYRISWDPMGCWRWRLLIGCKRTWTSCSPCCFAVGKGVSSTIGTPLVLQTTKARHHIPRTRLVQTRP